MKGSEDSKDPVMSEIPDPPTQLTRDDTLTNQTQVTFTWLAPENDGGASILDYAIEMYQSEEQNYLEVADGITST